MENKEALLQARKLLAGLIIDILSEKVSVRDAINKFPKNSKDESIGCAIHAILHYEADEDFRKLNSGYLEEQRDYLEYIANLLNKGEDLPANIINEYKDFYETAPIIRKKGIIATLLNLFRFTI